MNPMKFDPLTKSAINHTLHCLTGCAIGEVLGMAIGEALSWPNLWQTVLAIVLAFFFGYLLTFYGALRKVMGQKDAVKTALATDTISITSMETVDNAFIWLIPGAINATLSDGLFWWSLAVSLAVAFVITVPVNRWYIGRSGGHHHH
jgi:uncharacterized membrane protein YbjE (DUF340 family)